MSSPLQPLGTVKVLALPPADLIRSSGYVKALDSPDSLRQGEPHDLVPGSRLPLALMGAVLAEAARRNRRAARWMRKNQGTLLARAATTVPNRKSPSYQGPREPDEPERQGKFTSPYTGKVYDRFAPDGLEQIKVDRKGGLARSRAFETEGQRKQREQRREENKHTPEHRMFYPGLAPPEKVPRKKKEHVIFRHAKRAGNFGDIFKQMVVRALCDSKAVKETPLWYVEPLAGEGEYHISRLQEGKPPLWPKVEDLYEALSENKDVLESNATVKSWYETMEFLNNQDFEVVGPGAQGAEPETAETGEATAPSQASQVQWLPSTTLVAGLALRQQDHVTLIEDNPAAFLPLFNFVRNFSERIEPRVELLRKDGWKTIQKVFVEKEVTSEAHGTVSGKRGLVVIDPDYTRGSEDVTSKKAIATLHQHWRSATVVVMYPISPDREFKARSFIRDVCESDPSLDLLAVEWYIDTPNWTEHSEEAKWRGAGVLISNVPNQTAELISEAMDAVKKALSPMDNGATMRIDVDRPMKKVQKRQKWMAKNGRGPRSWNGKKGRPIRVP
mmetsp:Transcript_63363/g.151197  ORF Transcript_63363/g.151197 Transcript_63363/m.151197 type:complete len:558 (+) Transcript_63363:79-1752(+)